MYVFVSEDPIVLSSSECNSDTSQTSTSSAPTIDPMVINKLRNLKDEEEREEILGYENTPFEINCSGVERAEQQLNNIFKKSNWRKSFAILIHKAGDKLDINNYRGISLQNCIAKLFRAVINSRVVTDYEEKFSVYQFGFINNHRTEDSIFILKIQEII
ncbi:unnamed protein product [Mytilus coruscus]|uniref:Reverse transcriptase domain-containing protein n=1 Tax=Mytilus coruscus TaxID=42192 RepID=A0A6J8E6M2_MYTCO|nr:unnamed protein product [Mytilus coruscus]